MEQSTAQGQSNEEAVTGAVRDALKEYQSIVFNGNGYSAEWPQQATARGLLNISNSVDAIARYDSPKNVRLFDEMKVLRPHEVHARKDVMLEHYARTIVMEAKCALELTFQHVLPAIARTRDLLESERMLGSCSRIGRQAETLASQLGQVGSLGSEAAAVFCRDVVVPTMGQLRQEVDAAESHVPHGMWGLPTYEQLVHSAKM
jgi:glutamine synthetase